MALITDLLDVNEPSMPCGDFFHTADGPGVDQRRMDQHQTDAMDMWLVNETSRYMFRLLAVKMMFENPSLFGFSFKREDLYPYIPIKEQVKITDPVEDLVSFAEDHGISYADLKRANLWLRETKLNNKSHSTLSSFSQVNSSTSTVLAGR